LLGHQKKLALVPEVLHKMDLMKIEPDEKTYNYLIRAASHEGSIEKAEKYLEEAK
jgi:pentatricopeptide repeat protein